MRLWHKELIHVLPDRLVANLWTDCCEIARRINKHGTPGYYIVNRVSEYPIDHFIAYARLVFWELQQRGLKVNWGNFGMWVNAIIAHDGHYIPTDMMDMDDIFPDWHNDRYFWQNYYMLEEKYDCGLIDQEAWEDICDEGANKL